jgi:hypothetical protein
MIINKKHLHGKSQSQGKVTNDAHTQSEGKDYQLQGEDNKRLNSKKATNNEGTAAWQNSATRYQEDNVNKPSIERVMDAKDWVDNGSRL